MSIGKIYTSYKINDLAAISSPEISIERSALDRYFGAPSDAATLNALQRADNSDKISPYDDQENIDVFTSSSCVETSKINQLGKAYDLLNLEIDALKTQKAAISIRLETQARRNQGDGEPRFILHRQAKLQAWRQGKVDGLSQKIDELEAKKAILENTSQIKIIKRVAEIVYKQKLSEFNKNKFFSPQMNQSTPKKFTSFADLKADFLDPGHCFEFKLQLNNDDIKNFYYKGMSLEAEAKALENAGQTQAAQLKYIAAQDHYLRYRYQANGAQLELDPGLEARLQLVDSKVDLSQNRISNLTLDEAGALYDQFKTQEKEAYDRGDYHRLRDLRQTVDMTEIMLKNQNIGPERRKTLEGQLAELKKEFEPLKQRLGDLAEQRQALWSNHQGLQDALALIGNQQAFQGWDLTYENARPFAQQRFDEDHRRALETNEASLRQAKRKSSNSTAGAKLEGANGANPTAPVAKVAESRLPDNVVTDFTAADFVVPRNKKGEIDPSQKEQIKDKGFVVAEIGPEWCEACKKVKGLFGSYSKNHPDDGVKMATFAFIPQMVASGDVVYLKKVRSDYTPLRTATETGDLKKGHLNTIDAYFNGYADIMNAGKQRSAIEVSGLDLPVIRIYNQGKVIAERRGEINEQQLAEFIQKTKRENGIE